MDVPVFCLWEGQQPEFLFSDIRVGATCQGKMREVTGKPSMQEGMMDGDVRVRPYGCQWNVNDEHWDECPSVFDLRWNIRGSG